MNARLRRIQFIPLFAVCITAAWMSWTTLAAQSAPRGGVQGPPPIQYDPGLYSGLTWRMLGPFRGGRVDAVSGVPGRPNEFYMGAVNGGVWKTVDAGRVWKPVFDSQPVASIGAIAVAASAPDTIYVGSGESTLRDSTGYGNGMYKSTDAGKTWTHIGLDNTQHIARVAIDPRNPNVVFVAAIGNLYDKNPDRGIFKTTDGGRTWTKPLYKNDSVGGSDVVIDPANSQTVYAALWNTRRPTWYTYQPTNGPGGGIFKSTDGGANWTEMKTGLPASCIGKVGLGISAANPRRIYAQVDDFLPEGAPANTPCPGSPEAGRALGAGPAGAAGVAGAAGGGAGGGAGRGGGGGGAAGPPALGGFYRSDDAGATWTKMSGDGALGGNRGWYFSHVAVDPKNADIVYVPGVAVNRTKDGGKSWVALRGSPGGDDYHQAWVSPDDSDTVIIASDQGTVITRNGRTDDPRDVTWSSWLNQPIAQIYHVSVDYRAPYWVTGAQQDSGAVAVRSRGKFAGISMRDWEPIGAGGESGMTAGDPRHPGVIFGGTGGRFDLEMNASAGGSGPPVPDETANVQRLLGESAARTDWTQPLVFSRADQNALYYANQFLFKTVDDARTWRQMSPDLTRRDPPVPANLDATAAEDTNRNGRRGVIYAVSPSPMRAPMVWVGTDDGYIQVTTDDGKTWQNVTPPAVDAWSRVTGIEASHFDANEAYASVDRHQLTDFNPHIYRTRDLGKTWQEVTRGLPAGVYVHVVKEDPARKGLLFAGTERQAFVSFDDGDHWQTLQLNLPITSVRDFEVYGNDLIVATHGRGFWVIDDISPLRQINDDVAKAAAFLFKPSEATLYMQGGDNGTPTQKDEPQAPNPPNGAAIDYYLKTAATLVTLEIDDAAGTALGCFSSDSAAGGGGGGRGGGAAAGQQPAIPNTSALWRPAPVPFSAAAGSHRVSWAPGAGGGCGAAGNAGGGGGRGGGGRGGGRGGGAAGGQNLGPFTAKLTVDGQVFTQTFTLKPDPRTR